MPNLVPSAETLPQSLRERTRWTRLGPTGVPALVAVPERIESAVLEGAPTPVVIWLHGRTVSKELDPGRYLRWIRSGIAACALDLPGHGERFDERLQSPQATLEVVEAMLAELDGVVAAIHERADELGLGPDPGLDGASSGAEPRSRRIALGGMSAGGMVTLARLCRPHEFTCASVEATTGSWRWQMHRAMWDEARAHSLNPIEHLESWREIPFQAIHAAHDEWVNVEGQREFIDALRARSANPAAIDFMVFPERTGAPYEHAGFGRVASQAKDRQVDFWRRNLL